jgi:hypothetical protein
MKHIRKLIGMVADTPTLWGRVVFFSSSSKIAKDDVLFTIAG